MKRSGTLRVTPAKVAEWRRRTARALPRTSAKQRKRIVTLAEATVALVDWTGGGCQARIPGVCTGLGECAHHRLRRSQGGTDDILNLVWVCRACHITWIHRYPHDAAARGLLIMRKEAA